MFRSVRLKEVGRVLRVGPAPLPRWLAEANDGRDALIRLQVHRGAGRPRLIGAQASWFVVQPAVAEGPGDELRHVVALLAETLAVSPVQVSVVGGLTSSNKTVRLAGVTARDVLRLLRRQGAATA